MSVLVAEMGSPGIEVREIETVGGGVLNEVFLDDVDGARGQLVGEENGGWRVLMSTLDHERVTSEKVGIVLRVLDDLEEAEAAGPRAAGAAAAARRGRGGAAAGPARRALLAEGRPAAAAAAMAKLRCRPLETDGRRGHGPARATGARGGGSRGDRRGSPWRA